MKITKIFKGECSHRVRNCTTDRCQQLHGHSYSFEISFEGDPINQAQMVMDFSVLKEFVKPFVDSFDHVHLVCSNDDKEYVDFVKNNCKRYISAPFNWSCEMMALMIFAYIDKITNRTNFSNGEEPYITNVKVWETATGNCEVNNLDVMDFWNKDWFDKIEFSEGVINDWPEELKDCLFNAGDLVTKKVEKFIEVETYECGV